MAAESFPLFKALADALVQAGLPALSGAVRLEKSLPEVAEAAYYSWRATDEDDRLLELTDLLRSTPAEVRRQAEAAVEAVASGQPDRIRRRLADYLAAVPDAVRHGLRLLPGRGIPAGTRLRGPRDLLPLLPPSVDDLPAREAETEAIPTLPSDDEPARQARPAPAAQAAPPRRAPAPPSEERNRAVLAVLVLLTLLALLPIGILVIKSYMGSSSSEGQIVGAWEGLWDGNYVQVRFDADGEITFLNNAPFPPWARASYRVTDGDYLEVTVVNRGERHVERGHFTVRGGELRVRLDDGREWRFERLR
jgi:hypothetical protein